MSKDGGQAFPDNHQESGYRLKVVKGMTLRDYFAGQALAGMLACPALVKTEAGVSTSVNAYGYADAMIKERSKDE